MKKTIVSLVCMLLASTTFAENSVSVKAGNTAILKENTEAILEFDYSATLVEGKKHEDYLKGRGDDFVRDWPADAAGAANYFITRFNKKNKGMKVAQNASSPSYKMIVHVTGLDMGNGASGFVPFAGVKAGGIIMSGTIDIVDLTTHEVVCVLTMNKIKGTGHPNERARLLMCYSELASKLAKVDIKNLPISKTSYTTPAIPEPLPVSAQAPAQVERVTSGTPDTKTNLAQASATKSYEDLYTLEPETKYPNFHMGIRAGFSSSTLAKSAAYVFPAGGIAIDFKVAPLPIYVETGVYYINKGFTDEYSDEEEDNHSVLMPLLASYHLYVLNKMSIQPFFGGFLSYGFDFEEIDYGIRIGCGWNLGRLYANIGYDFGLKDFKIQKSYGKYATFETGKSGIFFMTLGFNWAGSK